MIENRVFQYVLYFTALVVIGSTGFYIIGGIIDNEGNCKLNPGPNDFFGTDSKVILIGSSDQLTLFEENAINDL